MGAIIKGACPCGFETEELLEGCGMGVFDPLIACQCRKCRALLSLKESDEGACQRCGSGELRRVRPVDTLPCPQCSEHSLKIMEAGCWD